MVKYPPWTCMGKKWGVKPRKGMQNKAKMWPVMVAVVRKEEQEQEEQYNQEAVQAKVGVGSRRGAAVGVLLRKLVRKEMEGIVVVVTALVEEEWQEQEEQEEQGQ